MPQKIAVRSYVGCLAEWAAGSAYYPSFKKKVIILVPWQSWFSLSTLCTLGLIPGHQGLAADTFYLLSHLTGLNYLFL